MTPPSETKVEEKFSGYWMGTMKGFVLAFLVGNKRDRKGLDKFTYEGYDIENEGLFCWKSWEEEYMLMYVSVL